MKKTLAIIITVIIALGSFCITAFADKATTANVFVTISDKDGKLVLVGEKIAVTDIDNDGSLTINDALYLAHEAKFTGGADAGYKSEVHPLYGLSLKKLWGTDNGGSYGYYLNNKSPLNLADTIAEGDYIDAFVYTDLVAWSDTYCYFNKKETKADLGDSIELTLTAIGFDAMYNPIEVPVKDAVITLNGEKTDFKTDAEGKVTLKAEKAGNFVVSAVSDTQTLVPPVLKLSVEGTEAQETTTTPTGDNTVLYMFAIIFAVCGLTVTVRAKRYNEK